MTPLGLTLIALGFALRAWAMHYLKLAGISCIKDLASTVRPNYYCWQGPYYFLKHPCYVGNALVFAGVGVVCFGTVLGGVALVVAGMPPFLRRAILESELRREVEVDEA